jgi:hypothetical protein
LSLAVRIHHVIFGERFVFFRSNRPKKQPSSHQPLRHHAGLADSSVSAHAARNWWYGYRSLSAPWHPTDTPLFVEQDKQPANNASSTPQAQGATAQPPKVEASAVTTNTQAPTPAPAATSSDAEPVSEKAQLAAAEAAAAAPPAAPVGYAPASLEDQERDERRRRHKTKLLIIHTRIAKFVTWLLLLGFVILPGTFKNNKDNTGNGVKNISLYVPFFSLRLLPIFFKTLFLSMSFLSVIIDLTCGDHPIGSPLVTYVASSISPWSPGSGISGRRSTIGYSKTYFSPD